MEKSLKKLDNCLQNFIQKQLQGASTISLPPVPEMIGPALIATFISVYLNGSTVNLQEPDEFSPLFMKIRSILIAETNLQRDHKLWLLLSLDLYFHKFESLPNEIFKFYEDHLGIDEMLFFKKPNNVLSVQTVESNKILDSYRSNVNVLQISTNHDIIDNNKAIPTTKFERNKLDFNIQHQQQQQQQQQKSGGNRLREKSGRPILGSGARKNFNQTVTTTSGECSSSCSDDVWQDNIDNKWDNSKEKTTTTWGGNNDNKRSIPKHNKGWEHDDRFEINYS